MNANVETITPERAAQMLAHPANANYRRLDEKTANLYAIAMRNGEWDLNGESIKIKADGSILDGQTRLRACVIAGVPFTSLVVYGVTQDGNIDTGRKRSLASVLEHHGEKASKSLAGALAWLWKYTHGKMAHDGGLGVIPHSEYLSLLAKHPDIRQAVTFTCWKAAHTVGRATLLTALYYLFSRKDEELARRFITAVCDGVGLATDDPAYRLRERLVEDRRSKAKLLSSEIAAIAIIAWNMYRHGRACRCLKWTSTGKSPTPFPEIE